MIPNLNAVPPQTPPPPHAECEMLFSVPWLFTRISAVALNPPAKLSCGSAQSIQIVRRNLSRDGLVVKSINKFVPELLILAC